MYATSCHFSQGLLFDCRTSWAVARGCMWTRCCSSSSAPSSLSSSRLRWRRYDLSLQNLVTVSRRGFHRGRGRYGLVWGFFQILISNNFPSSLRKDACRLKTAQIWRLSPIAATMSVHTPCEVWHAFCVVSMCSQKPGSLPHIEGQAKEVEGKPRGKFAGSLAAPYRRAHPWVWSCRSCTNLQRLHRQVDGCH